MIEIRPGLAIPLEEVEFVTDRASGPGGQHVNKSSTRVTLLFDVEASTALSPFQKQRVLQRLATRISKDGLLRVTAQMERSQSRNKTLAIERFAELVRGALTVEKSRRPTKPTRSSQRRRVDAKKRRGKTKSDRSRRFGRDD